MSSTRRAVAVGTVWLLLARLSHRVLGFASTLVLARLLTPDDFGIVAIAGAIVATLDLLRAFGLNVALIQNREAGPSHYHTAWTLNLLMSAAITLLLATLALPAARFYEEPPLLPVLLALAARPLIGGLRNIGIVELEKRMQFRPLFWLVLLPKLVQLAVALPLAFWLRNEWALVAGVLTASAAEVLLSYLLHGFRPRPSLARWRELLGFSQWLFAKNVLQFFTQRSADFTIAKLAGLRALGLFNLSSEIGFLPSSELVAPLNRAVFPAYASRSDDREALRRGLLEVLSLVALVVAPIGIGIALTAHLAVPILLGEQWREAVYLVPILSLAGVLNALGSNTGYLFYALGRPRVVTLLAAFHLAVLLPALLLGSLRAGAVGAAWATLGALAAAVVLSYGAVMRAIALELRALLGALWRPALGVAAMAGAVLWVRTAPPPAPPLGEAVLWLSLEAGAGAFVYLASVLAAWWLSGRPEGAEATVLHTLGRSLFRRPGAAGAGERPGAELP